MQPFKLIITNAGRTLMQAAVNNNTPITNYELWSKSGATTITPTTTSISGMTKDGVPDVMASFANKSTTFIVNLKRNSSLTYYPRTLAIMSGGTILGAVSVTLTNSIDNPCFMPLPMEGIDPKAFINSTNNPANDALSADTFDTLLNNILKEYNDKVPELKTGNTLYGNGANSPPIGDTMLTEVDVVTSPAELEAAKLGIVSMQEVYSSWSRFSQDSTTYSNEYNQSEIDAWEYDAANDVVRCTADTSTRVGFISPKNLKNYDLDVVMGSTEADDGGIGLLACAKYVLTFTGTNLRTYGAMRSPGGLGYTAISVYNDSYRDRQLVANRTINLKWGNGNYGSARANAGYVPVSSGGTAGWNKHPYGTRIRIERRNNVVDMWTSDLNSSTLVSGSKMTLDLTSMSQCAFFIEGARYGFTCISQKGAYWKILSFTDHDKVILDLSTDTVYVFNGTNWVIDPTRKAIDIIKPGRFVYSATNKRLYHRDTSGYLINLSYKGA